MSDPEKKIIEEIRSIPKDQPLKSGTIARLGLLGQVSRVTVNNIISDPKNGFTKIQIGNTSHFGVTIADCERYWEQKKPDIFSRL